MPKEKKASTHSRIRILMKRSYSDFDKEKKEEFLEDLAEISGCPKSEFIDVVFKRGCVYFEGKLERASVERLLELYENIDNIEGNDDAKLFKEFLEKHSVEKIYDLIITYIKNCRNKKAQVVFVHGWNGGEGSFGNIPKIISENIGVESLVYKYPTGVFSDSPSLNLIWRNLDNWVRNRLDTEKLSLIAHSMGGIITRKLIVSQECRQNPLSKYIKHVSFIASPHNGSVLAQLGKFVPLLQKVQFRELSADSPFLFDLNEHWQYWVQKNVPHTCKIRSLVGVDDKVVSINNARGLDPEAVPIFGAGHTDIVKRDSPNDEVVMTLNRFLREANAI